MSAPNPNEPRPEPPTANLADIDPVQAMQWWQEEFDSTIPEWNGEQ